MAIIWKGKISEEKDYSIDLHDRGYQFGDGIYEVTRVYQGKLFRLEDHLDRLFKGAEKAQMTLAESRKQVARLMEDLVRFNHCDTGYVYMQFTRGDGILRNHIFPDPMQSKVVSSGFTLDMAQPLDDIQKGIKTISINDERWAHCDIKSISLMGNVFAKNQAIKANAAEVIQIRDGYVTEGASSNVLIVKDGVIISRPNDQYILPGTTKLLIHQLAEQNNIPFMERPFTLAEVYQADEVWVSNILLECCPVIKVDDRLIHFGKRGPVCRQIQKAYQAEIFKETGYRGSGNFSDTES